MKKLCFFLYLFISFYPLIVFESQPPEYGLIFGSYQPESKGKKLYPKKMMIMRQKRKDGSDSCVFNVTVLPQFLFLATMQPKPVVIGIFSTRKDMQSYQQLADNLKDDALFISIDVNNSFALVKLLFMILRFEGIDLLDKKDKFPLFLFCERDFVLLQRNGIVSFKIGKVKPIGMAEFKPDLLLQNIKDLLLTQNKQEPEKKELEIEGEKEKSSSSFWDKLKKWFKTKLFNESFNMKQ